MKHHSCLLVWLCVSFWMPMRILLALDEVDAGFDPVIRGGGSVSGLAWHAASSKMYACVSGDKFNGQPITSGLLRFDADGNRDGSYSPVIAGTVGKVITQPDGKLLIAGQFSSVDGHPTVNLARLLADGNVDASFTISGATLPSDVRSLAATQDGTVYVGTAASVSAKYGFVDGSYKYYLQWPKLLYKINDSGAVDAAFAPEFSIAGAVASSSSSYAIGIHALLPQGTGDVVAGGTFTMVNGTGRTCLARLSPAGILDSAYAPAFLNTSPYPPYGSMTASVFSLVDAGNGRVYVGGVFTSAGGLSRRCMARLEIQGGVDSAFNPPILSSFSSSSSAVRELNIDSAGRVLVAGNFLFSFTGESNLRRNLVRLDANGVPTDGFLDGSSSASDVQPLPGGKCWIAGLGSRRRATASCNTLFPNIMRMATGTLRSPSI